MDDPQFLGTLGETWRHTDAGHKGIQLLLLEMKIDELHGCFRLACFWLLLTALVS